ncbi:MAG: ArnT family glycosyltransferase [Prevotella sp.]
MLCLLPVLISRDFTPANELRYLSIADEALANGNFFAFTNHGIPYADKPPLYLWLVMAAKTIAGKHVMLLLSMFSVIPAFVVAGIMGRWTAEEYGRDKGRLAVWMIMGNILMLVMMVTLRMDMLMTMFIVLALRCFFKIYQNRGNVSLEKWMFPLYVFMAVFSKGPIGIIVPFAATVTFLLIRRRAKDIKQYWGLRTSGVLVLLLSVWFVCVWAEGGRDYLYDLTVHQTIGRGINAFHHNRPFWFYAVHIFPVLFPLSFIVILTVCKDIRHISDMGDFRLFMAVIVVCTFVILSAISSKIDIYLLPLMPFVMTWAVILLPDVRHSRLSEVVTYLPFAMLAAGALLFPLVPPLTGIRYLDHAPFYIASSLLAIFSVVAVMKVCGDKLLQAVRLQAIGLYVTVFVAGFGMKHINPHIGLGEACRQALLLREQTGGRVPIYEWNIHRSEGMDVYLGNNAVRLKDVDEAFAVKGIIITKRRNVGYFKGHHIVNAGNKIVVDMTSDSIL